MGNYTLVPYKVPPSPKEDFNYLHDVIEKWVNSMHKHTVGSLQLPAKVKVNMSNVSIQDVSRSHSVEYKISGRVRISVTDSDDNLKPFVGDMEEIVKELAGRYVGRGMRCTRHGTVIIER